MNEARKYLTMDQAVRYFFMAISALASVIWIGIIGAASSEHINSTPQEVFDSMRDSFQANKAKGVHCSLSMGLERAAWRRQWWIDVDDGNLQDGKGQNRQSQCDVRGEGQGLGRRFQPSNGRHLGLASPGG